MTTYIITYYDEYIDDNGLLQKGFNTITTTDYNEMMYYKNLGCYIETIEQ